MIRDFDKDLILDGIPDKDTHKTTTSIKFKKDLIDAFSDDSYGEATVLEIGTHMGHTTKVLSYLFKKVITINVNPIDDNYICKDIDNIEHIVMDSYRLEGWPKWKNISVVLIDAIHNYEAIKKDIQNSLKLPHVGDRYLVFDDYGNRIHSEVKRAIDESINNNLLIKVGGIGYPPQSLVNDMIFDDWEGLICQVK